ncbi:MAG: CBS domain-containing protein [Armatimonadota bacterium]|nr:CBS domain-containing protein [Armatimonadota bacterium]
MRVGDCMSSPVQTIGPDAPAWEALGTMRRHRIRRLPVVEDGALVGIVTWTDLVRVQPPSVGGVWEIPHLTVGVRVRHVMTPAPVVVGPETSLEEAAALMRRHKVGGLPVTDGGRLVGIVTESDLFEVFAEVLGMGPGEARLHVTVGSVTVELPRIVAGLARSGVPILSLQTLRFRGAEGIDLVVHARDARRAREVLGRLALEVSLQTEPAPARKG